MIEVIMETMRDRIRKISRYYSKKNQLRQAIQEIDELRIELKSAGNPFGYEDLVSLPDNTWSECADVIIMIAQLAMQHGKEEEVQRQIEYKVDRQLNRIAAEQGGWKARVMRTFLGGQNERIRENSGRNIAVQKR